MTVMDADEYRRYLRSLSWEKIDLATAKWPGLEMANMVDPTAEAQRAFAQQRAYEQFYASYASTVHGGLEPVFDEKESTKRTPDGPDGSRTAGPSLELRQDIQASRASAVVHAPPEHAEKFLHFILPCDRAEDRIGDLEEKFHKAMVPKYGYQTAVRWYWVPRRDGERKRKWQWTPEFRRALYGTLPLPLKLGGA